MHASSSPAMHLSARKRRGKRDTYLRSKFNSKRSSKRNTKSKAMRQARRELKVMAQQNATKKGDRIVASLWPDEAILVESSSSVSDCARLMTAVRADSALVTCNGALCGIITDNDICRRVINQDFDPKTTPVALAMTGKPMTVSPSHKAIDALATMVDKHFRHLPVAEGTTIYGQLMISKCIGEAVTSLKNRTEESSKKSESDASSISSSVIDDSFLTELGQMTLGELMQSSDEMPPTISESAKVREAVRVMSKHKKTAVLTVKKDGEVCGILTTKDVLLRVVAAREDPSKTSCSRVHTPYPDMVPHTMTILEALQHMSKKKYLHLPVRGGDTTMADGTSGLVDALQLITHLLRPPLPDIDEGKNQAKDDAVLRKLLRMSGVGVGMNDFSVSDATSQAKSTGDTIDDDRSSVFSRSRIGDEDSASVADLRRNLSKEATFKLCDMTGRWHRFSTTATFQNVLHEIKRIDPSAVSEVVEKENSDSTNVPPSTPTAGRRALGTIFEDGSASSNTIATTSETKKGEFGADGDDESNRRTYKLEPHIHIMYEDEDMMWTVVASEACLSDAVMLAREQGWKSVQLHLKKADGSPPKQRAKPMSEKKDEKTAMPPPMPRAPAEIRAVEETVKSVQQRIEALQTWRDSAKDETTKIMLEQQKEWRASQATSESELRRQIEAVQKRAEKLADDSNAAALKQQQQWSLMHELTMKKISKVAEEIASADGKVAVCIAPLELKVKSMAERGQMLASGLDEINEKHTRVSLLVSTLEDKLKSAESAAADAAARADEAFKRVAETVVASASKSSTTEEHVAEMSRMRKNLLAEIATLQTSMGFAQKEASSASASAKDALEKVAAATEHVRSKHEKMIEMVATLRQQAKSAEQRASEASEKAMEVVKTTIDLSGRSERASEAIAELKSKFQNVGATKTDVSAVVQRDLAPIAKDLEQFKTRHEEVSGKTSAEVSKLHETVTRLRETVKLLESKMEESKQTVAQQDEANEANIKRLDAAKLTPEQMAMGAGAMCLVSIATAAIVSMIFSKR